MDILKKIQELHKQGYHIELTFTWLSVSKKDVPVYFVALCDNKDFDRICGSSTNSVEEAFIKVLNQLQER
ncbi:hypothetical protein Calkr_2147 [Caldicellulosiruptor acetigenus I77R1B]|uniref:YcaO domain-containing protein n=1 Tax=Caldicellulosiruptor acetigenus (strain ATCC 700853 / DSM 12137 / I77R1B) TaxID=632335 RepID=E4S5V2_CALA7|nr:hypothetical protein [Caldicellulosiruptor acetigenus]ADQ41612.1 hypothetical protein Calkr_2147 [Caldicellulosiruptor acetigenus I77R1B]